MPTFTSNWTDNRLESWLPFLEPLKGQAVKALEIGTFEGRTARWFLENILTGQGSFLHCIDPYRYRDRVELRSVQRASKLVERNLAEFGGRYKLHRDFSFNVLPQLSVLLDLAYVDGDHSAAACFHDMCHSFRLLKSGGIMIVDDIQETRPENWGLNCPLAACHLFVRMFGDRCEKLWHDDYTMGFRKP